VWSVNPLLRHEAGQGTACATEADLTPGSRGIRTAANEALFEISRRYFFALNGRFLDEYCLIFPLTEVVSGKYVQSYFRVLARMGSQQQDEK
jgi:hypothetical protein